MSFLKYIENKKYQKPILDLQEYKQKLEEKIFSSNFNENLSKLFLNIDYLDKLFKEINFPYTEEFLISLVAENLPKIRNFNIKFIEWYLNAADKLNFNLIQEINNHISKYKYYLYLNEELDIKNAQNLISSLLDKAEFKSKETLNNIELLIKNNSDWQNSNVKIQPIFKEDFLVNSFKIFVNENYFILKEKLITEENIQNHYFLADFEYLKEKILNPSIQEFSKLYLLQPKNNRKIFEDIKRNLSLGFNQFISGNFIFTEQFPQENGDIWKIKIDRKYLVKNENYYKLIKNDTPVRWIELLKEENEN